MCFHYVFPLRVYVSTRVCIRAYVSMPLISVGTSVYLYIYIMYQYTRTRSCFASYMYQTLYL